MEFAFDGANQLVSSTSDGVTVRYAYDAAGRLVREGGRAYRYGYLDKVLSVTEGKRKLTYTYHADGQLARADYGDGRAEDFAWDGLALVRRGGESFICEPHVGGGNPIASSEGTAYFNDILGTTVGTKSRRRYTAAALTAFGEPIQTSQAFFTGKPQVEGLGRVFLYRNYRADLAKWQTADPLGYPDGWNQLAYCGNDAVGCLDFLGACTVDILNVYWRECHIVDVWANCNHSFDSPEFSIVMGRKYGATYDSRLVLDINGVRHTFVFTPKIISRNTSIRRVDSWNKEVVYDVRILVEIKETWDEDVIDEEDGGISGRVTREIIHKQEYPQHGAHNIPE